MHAQNFGWLDWAKNGQSAGTTGYAWRLEGIEIRLVEKAVRRRVLHCFNTLFSLGL